MTSALTSALEIFEKESLLLDKLWTRIKTCENSSLLFFYLRDFRAKVQLLEAKISLHRNSFGNNCSCEIIGMIGSYLLSSESKSAFPCVNKYWNQVSQTRIFLSLQGLSLCLMDNADFNPSILEHWIFQESTLDGHLIVINSSKDHFFKLYQLHPTESPKLKGFCSIFPGTNIKVIAVFENEILFQYQHGNKYLLDFRPYVQGVHVPDVTTCIEKNPTNQQWELPLSIRERQVIFDPSTKTFLSTFTPDQDEDEGEDHESSTVFFLLQRRNRNDNNKECVEILDARYVSYLDSKISAIHKYKNHIYCFSYCQITIIDIKQWSEESQKRIIPFSKILTHTPQDSDIVILDDVIYIVQGKRIWAFSLEGLFLCQINRILKGRNYYPCRIQTDGIYLYHGFQVIQRINWKSQTEKEMKKKASL